MDVSDLPHLNAALNLTSASLLAIGFAAIRRRRIGLHRACMVAAFAVSVVFLVSYLAYHAQVGSRRFPGTGAIRTVYLGILLTHTVLAAATPVLALVTLYRAVRGDFARHRAIARIT